MTSITTFEQMEATYKEFKKNPPEDSFKQSVTELKILRNLVKLATLEKLTKQAQKYQTSLDKLTKKLKDEGYDVRE